MNFLKAFFVVGIFILFQQAIAADNDCSYRVIKVQDDDMLVIRFGPALKYREVGAIPHNSAGVKMMGPDIKIGESRWVPIKYKRVEGWVNRAYLKKDCQFLRTASTQKMGSYHTVVSGETLFSIARHYGHKIADIASWNDLQVPYHLSEGQRLRLSPQMPCSYHVVKVGEKDMLWIRSEPRISSKRMGGIPHNGTEIQITGEEKMVKNIIWVPIKYRGIKGWVNRGYLEKDC
jgi:LysM repeat protein